MEEKIARVKLWREAMDRLMDSRVDFQKQIVDKQKRTSSQLEDARREYQNLQDAVNSNVEATVKKEREITELQVRIAKESMENEQIKEVVYSLEPEIRNLEARKTIASACTASKRDLDLSNNVRKQLKTCATLTGVRFEGNAFEEVKGGFVVNNVTNKVKTFKIANSTAEEKTKKIWNTIENTAFFKLRKDA